VLPVFTGVAVHDAWAPYDTYKKATHALCNAHAVRELVYVLDTAPAPLAALATQAIEAMVEIKDIVAAARDNGHEPDPDAVHGQQQLLRSAVVLAQNATAARATKLERKYHALFTRLNTRWQDYQRCVTNPKVPWDNNPAEQTIRMPKLRDQGIRLPTHPDRRRGVRRDPLLHRHRHPPRPEHARRPHPGRRPPALDLRHLNTTPPTDALAPSADSGCPRTSTPGRPGHFSPGLPQIRA
jgi:hypothetical protein